MALPLTFRRRTAASIAQHNLEVEHVGEDQQAIERHPIRVKLKLREARLTDSQALSDRSLRKLERFAPRSERLSGLERGCKETVHFATRCIGIIDISNLSEKQIKCK
jgi:hypothetical protein